MVTAYIKSRRHRGKGVAGIVYSREETARHLGGG
jgi:hypothetical protein